MEVEMVEEARYHDSLLYHQRHVTSLLDRRFFINAEIRNL